MKNKKNENKENGINSKWNYFVKKYFLLKAYIYSDALYVGEVL